MAKLTPPQQDYHAPLDNDTKKMMEQSSFNYYTQTGHRMRIPPKLYSDLKAAGVSMKYIVADPSLEQ